MDGYFKQDGYTFVKIKSSNDHRPYKVRCLETGGENDSALSYEDAASLIIGPILFAKSKLEADSKDIDYVRKIFEQYLLGRKQSECDRIIQEEILPRQLVKGSIVKLPEKEKYSRQINYTTEEFSVCVLFEKGLFCGATKIVITNLQ